MYLRLRYKYLPCLRFYTRVHHSLSSKSHRNRLNSVYKGVSMRFRLNCHSWKSLFSWNIWKRYRKLLPQLRLFRLDLVVEYRGQLVPLLFVVLLFFLLLTRLLGGGAHCDRLQFINSAVDWRMCSPYFGSAELNRLRMRNKSTFNSLYAARV